MAKEQLAMHKVRTPGKNLCKVNASNWLKKVFTILENKTKSRSNQIIDVHQEKYKHSQRRKKGCEKGLNCATHAAQPLSLI